MLVDPKKVCFESQDDVVDYVTKGFLPPLRKHFDQVMEKVDSPNPVGYEGRRGEEVLISETAIPEIDRKTLRKVMDKVYRNRVMNQNKAIIGFGSFLMLLGGMSIRRRKKREAQLEELKRQAKHEVIKGEHGDIDVYRF